MATEWYYQIMNDVVGPLTSSQLVDRVRAGQVKEDTLIRKDDSQWVPARQVSGLLEAVEHDRKTHRICPYCGATVDNPPTTCHSCNRKLVLSFNSRIVAIGKGKTKASRVARDRDTEARVAREQSDRSDIVRYALLLGLWLAVLLLAPYLIYLASTGRLFFAGDLATVSVVAVIAALGGLYYFISRMA